jgi:predicted dehydrogenase
VTTRLAVAGLGWLGESLIKDIPKISGLRLAAVQDVRPDAVADIAARYGVPQRTVHYADLLRAEGIDAVAICTPNAFHAAQAQQALLAGKHVLVQKPLALSAADAAATTKAASETGRVLFVDYSYRFLETMLALRSALSVAGEVRWARATFHNIYGPGAEKTWFFDPALSGGGALIDLGVHLLDLLLWLLQPRNVHLEYADLSGGGSVEPAATLRVQCDHVPCEVSVSWNADLPATDISLELATERDHRLRWENVDGSFFRFRTLDNSAVVADRETTLREDTLRAFVAALATGDAPTIDERVYALLDRAYGRTP